MKSIATCCALAVWLVLLVAGPEAEAKEWPLEPYLAIVGGMGYETIQGKPGDDREDRGHIVALTRIGLRGSFGRRVYVESEFEVNAGPHGTSVWEGQAALQVRNQLLRLDFGSVVVDTGHFTDPASVDFFSAHVLDQLLTDRYTRDPLLASGYNRGLGLGTRWEFVPGLKAGFTLNWANPTSTTASLVVGGTYPPFSRFYLAAHQQVGRDASGFPADEYDIMVLSPSLTYVHEHVEARAAAQVFRVDTNRSSTKDEPIDGYNLRAGVMGKLLEGALRIFGNVSRVQNEVVDKNDGNRLSGELFNGLTLGGGVDYDYFEKNGVGAQYVMVRDQQGYGTRTTYHYVNLGTTWWITENTALGARAGMLVRCEEPDKGSCEHTDGQRSYFATLRSSF